MGFTLTAFADGTTMAASDVRARINTIEQWLNESSLTTDLKSSSSWVDRVHVFKPEFSGAPAPRCVAVTADTHWRTFVLNVQTRAFHHSDVMPDTYVNVPGGAATFHVPFDTTPVIFLASIYAWQYGGLGAATETQQAAVFALYVDGSQVAATQRPLYTQSNGNFLFARKQLSTVYMTTLNKGIHHAGVRVKVDARTGNDVQHIFVDARNLVVDVLHR